MDATTPRRLSVSAAVHSAARSQRMQSGTPLHGDVEDSPQTHHGVGASAIETAPAPSAAPPVSSQYVSRGAFLILKQQLADERIAYLREVMALRQQVMDLEGTLKGYYEAAVERHASLYYQLQGVVPASTTTGANKANRPATGGASNTALSPTVNSPQFTRRSSLFALDAPTATGMIPKDGPVSGGPVVVDLSTSHVLSDGKSGQIASPGRVPASSKLPLSPTSSSRCIVHLHPPEPPRYVPISLQLVPAERLAAALSSVSVLEQQQEAHARTVAQLAAVHEQELASERQKYAMLFAEQERRDREHKHSLALKDEANETFRERCKVDAFRAVEVRLHAAEADRQELAEHAKALHAKLEEVQVQLEAERELASENANQLAAVRQQQGLILHERSELRSALVAIQKDRNRLEFLNQQGTQRGGGSVAVGSGSEGPQSAWAKLAESARTPREDPSTRAVQFTGGGFAGAVTDALQRSRRRDQGALLPNLVAATNTVSSPSGTRSKGPITPRRPIDNPPGLEDALLGVRRRN